MVTSGRDRFAGALEQDRLSGTATNGSVAGSILQFRQEPYLRRSVSVFNLPSHATSDVEKDLHPAGVRR